MGGPGVATAGGVGPLVLGLAAMGLGACLLMADNQELRERLGEAVVLAGDSSPDDLLRGDGETDCGPSRHR